MGQKTERWMMDVFPGEEKIYTEYRGLPPRELAIVAAAVLDVALAELLLLRLADYSKEAELFLGLTGDGRAPAGSFGARIQLAILVGLITPQDSAILRAMKELRNLFAHRVRVDFLSPAALSITQRLFELWRARFATIVIGDDLHIAAAHIKTFSEQLEIHSEAAEGLVLMVVTVYQAYFHRLLARTKHITDVVQEPSCQAR